MKSGIGLLLLLMGEYGIIYQEAAIWCGRLKFCPSVSQLQWLR